jgi:hypothetical protein
MNLGLLAKYQRKNPEKFNNGFIEKYEDNILEQIEEIFSTLAKTTTGIDVISVRKLNELEFKQREIQNVDISRFDLIEVKLRITGIEKRTKLEKTEDIIVPLFYFKNINNRFIFNGNNYFPIYQIVDRDTYNVKTKNSKNLILKTLLMGINIKSKLSKEEITLLDDTKLKIEGKILRISLFKKDLNFLYYIFAKFGIKQTIKDYLGKNKIVFFNDEKKIKKFSDLNYQIIKINNSTFIGFKDLETDLEKDFFISFYSLLNQLKTNRKIEEDKIYWERELGKNYTKNLNNLEEKSKMVMISLERIFDVNTKKILKVKDEDKKDIYAVIKWMISNFNLLIYRDNMDLKNKRIRLTEYLLNPLIMKFSDNSYRMIHSKGLSSFETKKGLFRNISIMYLVKEIIRNDLLRYDNTVNCMELFSCYLKGTFKGPQSISSKSKVIPVKYRNVHKSYIGKCSLVFASAGDPGLTVTLSPFLRNNMFFDERNFDEIKEELMFDKTDDDELEEIELSEEKIEKDEE